MYVRDWRLGDKRYSWIMNTIEALDIAGVGTMWLFHGLAAFLRSIVLGRGSRPSLSTLADKNLPR